MGKNKKIMYKRLATDLFYRNKLIKLDEIEDYAYGIELLTLKIIHILLFAIFGFIYGKILSVIIFLAFYSFIRSRIGGYHAKNCLSCFFYSIIISISLCLCLELQNINVIRLIFSYFILTLLLCILYPKISFRILFLFLFILNFSYQLFFPIWFAELISILLYFFNILSLKMQNIQNSQERTLS